MTEVGTHDVAGFSVDSLFSVSRVARDGQARNSVVVVGLPRSGSSFLSHVLSQIPGWYVFDDLLLRREAANLMATRTMSAEARDRLIEFLGWQIWARRKHGLYAIPNVEKSEVAPMNAALRACFSGKDCSWLDLQEEWLVRLAARSGCLNWGFKSPHESQHLDQLLNAYPQMKCIFIMRQPERVLASYKHMPVDSQDGHPHNFHPVVHAYIWRRAADAYVSASRRFPGRVLLVRFEELVGDTTLVANSVSRFLDAPHVDGVSAPAVPNTSFAKGQSKELTGLETVLAGLLIGNRCEELGFARLDRKKVRGADYSDFVKTTARFAKRRSTELFRSLKSRVAWWR